MKPLGAAALLFLVGSAHAAMPRDLGAWGAKAKAELVHSLKDPESARFREMFVSSQSDGGSLRPVLCGQVNAKNSMGGYGGFQRFVVTSAGVTIEEDGSGGFSFLWDDACGWKLRPIR
jgi:hypothetical protein